jgi:alcohol dehydrogenase (cytochrome c)
LAWAFQPSPHDTHDWDAVETPVLVDADFRGRPRKMLMQTSRNGYFFVLDRTTGESLLTIPFGPVNWSLGVDQKGRPIPNPAKEPARDGRLIAPDEGGMTNYRSPSFDAKTGLFIVDAHPSYGIYFAKPADGVFGWAGADYDVWGKGVLDAIDYQTGTIRWTHELGPGGSGAGVLTTDSGLTFTGDSTGNVLALRTADGKTLWHAGEGEGMQSSPISYSLDGRQYIVTSAGGVLFAWALPESIATSMAVPKGIEALAFTATRYRLGFFPALATAPPRDTMGICYSEAWPRPSATRRASASASQPRLNSDSGTLLR